MEIPECWCYGAQEQTVIHLYIECQKWRWEQRRLSRELGQLGISWQPRPERRWLGRLLANEWAVGPVSKFLEGTEVGSREGNEGEGARMAEGEQPRRREPGFWLNRKRDKNLGGETQRSRTTLRRESAGMVTR